jgi:hypothetical protein
LRPGLPQTGESSEECRHSLFGEPAQVSSTERIFKTFASGRCRNGRIQVQRLGDNNSLLGSAFKFLIGMQ